MAKEKARNALASKGHQSSRWDGPPNQSLEVDNTPPVMVVDQHQFTTLMNKIEVLTAAIQNL